ncbi:MAG: PAS domain-containing protein, partial [Acidobacteria bacterium]|nr:PAS domain-containing protein [Acidobacteriota bacterium]
MAETTKVDISSAISAFSALFEDGIVFLSDDGSIISANEKWLLMHNFQGDEIKGLKFDELCLDENNREKFRISFSNVARTGEYENIVLEFHKDKKFERSLKEIIIKKLKCSEQGSCFAVIEKDVLREKDSDNLLLATYRIASSAVVSETLYELFSTIHQTISQLIDARNFYIALYDLSLIH